MIALTISWDNNFSLYPTSDNAPRQPRPKAVLREAVSSTSAGTAVVEYFYFEKPTMDQVFDKEIFLLAQAAEDGNVDVFIHLVNNMNWQVRPVEEHLRAIDLALKVEAHLTARKLAQEGALRFPNHPEMAKYAHVLSPVKIVRTGLPPDAGIAQNNLWLKQNRQQYLGRWVALRDGELLAWGNSFQELRQQVGPLKDTRILATKVY